MKIYDPNGIELFDGVSDNSYRQRDLMSQNNVTVYVSYTDALRIPVGSYVDHEGIVYTLERLPNLKKNGSRNIEHTFVFESPQAKLSKYKLRNLADKKLKFPFTAKPYEFLKLIVDNLNQRDSGWLMGEYIDAVETVVSFNHTSIDEALSMIAEAFETEWEIDGKTIHLRKVEYNKDNPLVLSFGRGNGFKAELSRIISDSSKSVEILFTQGGERNIDFSKYGSSELLLPKSQTIRYDGSKFEDEEGFNPDLAKAYISDAEGYSIQQHDKQLKTHNEDSLDCTNIYPKRVGVVSAVEVVNAEKNLYDFFDTSIPENLNYSQYRIDGEKMTVAFQSGTLSGKEFDLEQTDKKVTGYVHSERRFKLVPQEIDGQTMPNDTWKPAIGDKYAVFGMMLPDAYICENDTITGASWEMMREAVKYLYDNAQDKFTFTGVLDGIWAKKDWVNIGGKIRLGGYVLFKDEQLEESEDGEAFNGTLIRIVGVKDNVNNPHSPTITLSNDPVHGNIRSDLAKIPENEVVAEQQSKEVRAFAKRGFRDAKETMQMLSDSLLNFSEGINPVWVQTMQMLVGDESLQFRFVTNKTNPHVDTGFQVSYASDTKQLTVTSGILQHMTHGIVNLSASHSASEYQYWDMDAYISAVLADPAKKYYLYAQCADDHADNTFILSETAISLDWQSDYYYLLVGILNSENDGDRSFAPLYGFTEILPGRITTDKVVSSSGLNFFDLITGALRSGRFDSAGNMLAGIDVDPNRSNVAILKGTLSQSPSGDTSVIPTDRGTFSAAKVYYTGDQVQYSGTTYICLQQTTAGIMPTNAIYWKVYAAKGADGTDGDSAKMFSIVAPSQLFKYNNSALKGTPAPESITLSIVAQNLVVSTVTWTMIDEAGAVTNMGTGVSLNVLPILMQDYKTARFKAAMGAYSDEVTIYKLGDGDSSYTVILSNENHAIACDASGAALSGELVTNQVTFAGRAKCQVTVFRGAQQIAVHPLGADRYSVAVSLVPTSCSVIQGISSAINYAEFGISAIAADSAYVDVTVAITDSVTSAITTITRRMTLVKQKQGVKGNNGRIFSYRGDYSTTTYTGNATIAQVVKYNNSYYYTTETAGNITGVVPTNTSAWTVYGASFESVATGLLFANSALIAGWNFFNDIIKSSKTDANGDPVLILDGINGNVQMAGSFLGKIESSANGNRFVIDPETKSFKMFNANNLEILSMSFTEYPGGAIQPSIILRNYAGTSSTIVSTTKITGQNITVDYPTLGMSYQIGSSGIRAYKTGVSGDDLFSVVASGDIATMKIKAPTSPSNLNSGEVWRNGTALNIVP